MNLNDHIETSGQSAGHFWYQGRRRLIERMLAHALGSGKIQDRRILDVGAGLGDELELLSAYGRAEAVDKDGATVAAARALGRNVACVDIENEIPDGRFNAVCLFDVLEHLRDDLGALTNLRQCLGPGGSLLFTVPAFPALFSGHDRATGHFRRYTKGALKSALEAAGYKSIELYHWNTALFPLEALSRLYDRARGSRSATDVRPVNAAANALLLALLRWEAETLFMKKWLPYGLTIYGRARI